MLTLREVQCFKRVFLNISPLSLQPHWRSIDLQYYFLSCLQQTIMRISVSDVWQIRIAMNKISCTKFKLQTYIIIT